MVVRDVREPANIRTVGCRFHVQNPSDADLLRDKNDQLLYLLRFNSFN